MIGASTGKLGTAIAQQNLRSVLSFCNTPQMSYPEAYIQLTPGLITDDGEVTNSSTNEFLGELHGRVRAVRRSGVDRHPAPGMNRSVVALFVSELRLELNRPRARATDAGAGLTRIRHARVRADAHPHRRGGRPSDCRKRRWRVRPCPTHLALIGVALTVATGTALAADVSTPVVCGSNECMPLPTSTLHGLLMLPEALQPADPPPAQPFVLFHVDDLYDGAMHQVVYVPRDDGALLGFAPVNPRWRLVPADDAKLLVDGSGGRDALPRPGRRAAPLGVLFAAHDRSRWRNAPWALLAVATRPRCWESRRTQRSRWFPVDPGSPPPLPRALWHCGVTAKHSPATRSGGVRLSCPGVRGMSPEWSGCRRHVTRAVRHGPRDYCC